MSLARFASVFGLVSGDLQSHASESNESTGFISFFFFCQLIKITLDDRRDVWKNKFSRHRVLQQSD